jgi:pimeloyl-ACP methyl ester carboxylesterase
MGGGARPGATRSRAGSDAFSDGAIEAFTGRLRGERAAASELLYRTFLLREAVPVISGRYAGLPLEVPTLLLVGERDAVIPARAVREQAARADALELEVVPEARHFIVDENPELVADRTLGFFAR